MGGGGKYIVYTTPEVIKGKTEFQNSVSEIRISLLKIKHMKIERFVELLDHRMAKGEVFLFEWPGIRIGGITLQYEMYKDVCHHTSVNTTLLEDFLSTAKKSSHNAFIFSSEKGAAIAQFDLENNELTFVESYKR